MTTIIIKSNNACNRDAFRERHSDLVAMAKYGVILLSPYESVEAVVNCKPKIIYQHKQEETQIKDSGTRREFDTRAKICGHYENGMCRFPPPDCDQMEDFGDGYVCIKDESYEYMDSSDIGSDGICAVPGSKQRGAVGYKKNIESEA